jgi:hypothetical protein
MSWPKWNRTRRHTGEAQARKARRENGGKGAKLTQPPHPPQADKLNGPKISLRAI